LTSLFFPYTTLFRSILSDRVSASSNVTGLSEVDTRVTLTSPHSSFPHVSPLISTLSVKLIVSFARPTAAVIGLMEERGANGERDRLRNGSSGCPIRCTD